MYYKFDLDSCISSPIEMSVVKTVLFCLVLKVIRFVLLVLRKRAIYKLLFKEREKERVEFEFYLLLLYFPDPDSQQIQLINWNHLHRE